MKKQIAFHRRSIARRQLLLRKLAVSFMSFLLTISTTPMCQAEAKDLKSQPHKVAQSPKEKVNIRKGPHTLTPVNTVRKFSSNPADLEITTARVFLEPLIPMTSKPVAGENLALASAIDAFKNNKAADDVSDFTKFISAYPESRWRASVQLNIGRNRFSNGYLTQALNLWKSSWELSKRETNRLQRDVADTAISEALLLDARVGRMAELEKYFAEIEKRPILGSNEERVKSAREGFKRMTEKPSEAFKCGPYAVDSILYRNEKNAKRSDIVEKALSTANGTSLLQVSEIAKQVGLKFQIAKRATGAEFMVPSIIHFKLEHFAAITAAKDGLYQVKDPTFGDAGTTWLSAKALDAETEGYSLVPAGKLPPGWSAVSNDDAKKVWGKGGATGFDANVPFIIGTGPPTSFIFQPRDGAIPMSTLNGQRGQDDGDDHNCINRICDPKALFDNDESCVCHSCNGLAASGARSEQCTLNISDTPLRYTPPIGPPIDIHLNYAWLETNQPSTYTFTNFGQNWTSQWLSYLTVDPVTQTITLRRPSGGSEIYVKDPISGLYPPNFLCHDTMVNLGGGSYQSTSVEGWVCKYTLSDASSPPRVFMTEWKDPQGNSAIIQYDANFRITTVTDAISQVTAFSYVSNTVGNSGFYKVATISDPFGRTAQFAYDSTNTNLLSITDAVGMKSEFIYDPTSSFISALTTPYGTTSFISYTPPNSAGYTPRGLRTIYPDGTSSVAESWIPHINKLFYWGRNATKLYPNDPALHDYSHCRVTKWCYDAGTNLLEPVLYFTQDPFENPTYYKYAGQTAQDFTGSSNRPMQVYQSIGNQLVIANIGGTKTTGDTLTITVFDSALPGGSQGITYTVLAGDTLKSITAGLASAMNANTNLKGIGVRATSSLTTIGLSSQSQNSTTYTKTTSGGATETLTLKPGSNQFAQATIFGSAVTGDSIGFWFLINGGYTFIGYTVLAGNTLANIASGLAAAINADTTLQANQVSATSSGTAVNITGMQINLIQLSIAQGASAKASIDYVKNGTMCFNNREYNEFGLMTKSIDSQGRTFQYIYDATNKVDLLEVREVQGTDNFLIDYFEYNAAHQVTKHKDGSGQQTVMTYNAQGQLKTTTDANSNVTTNNYTGNFLTSVDGPLAGTADVTTLSYDSVGRLFQTTDSEGHTLQFSYDNLNRPTQTLFPDGTTTKIVYDRLDPVLTKDRLDRWSQSGVNNLGQIEYTIDPEGRKTQFEWCTCGAIASLTDSRGQKTTWHHDVRGRTLEIAYADSTKVSSTYDPISGRLRSKTDAMNQTTSFTYFADGSPFQTEYINAVNPTSTVSTFYDPKFNRVSSVQSDWGVTSYTYNNYITNPAGAPITGGGAVQLVHNNVIPNSDIDFVYDALGRVTNRNINGAANASSWAFDAISRVTSETNTLGTFNYTYVDNTAGSSKGVNRLASVAYPNGQSTVFDWYGNSNDNRLRGISHLAPGGVPRSQFNYAHNAGGEIIRWGQQNAGLTSQISSVVYDKVSQLTASVAGDGSASAPYSNQYFYGYDPASNRTGVQTVNVETARIGGTVTTGNTLTITVKNELLPGGQKAINYVVVGGDTLSTIAGKLAAAITSDTDMQTVGVNAIANSTVISIKSVSSGVTTYTPSTSGGATETITTGISKNAIQNATIGGTVTTGNIVTLTIYDAALAGGNKAINYTVAAGNTLAVIAASLATNINADAGLSAAGITATSASSTVNIKSLSTNLTTYKGSVSAGATETVSLAMNMNGTEIIVIGGTKTTSDVLSVNIYDQGLTGGKRSISYTVLAGDTLTTITSALTTAINGDTQLQGIGVSASASGTQLSMKSVSVNTTSYTTTRSATATETIVPGINPNGIQTAVIGGTKTTGNVLTITVFDLGLAGGSKAVNYTVLAGDTLTTIAAGVAAAINADANLSAIGVTATSVNTVINIKSTSIHASTYTQSLSAASTETITLSKGIGVTMAAHNNVNQVTNISAGGTTRYSGATNKAVKSATVASQAIVISGKAPSQTSFSQTLTGVPQETGTIDASNQRVDGTTSITWGGTPVPGDVVYVTVRNPALPGGQQIISYTVKTGDALGNIAYGIASTINANQFLYPASFSSYQSGNASVIQSPPGSFVSISSTYSYSIVGKPTETLTLGSNTNGNTSATVGGTVTTNDVVSITVTNDKLPGGSQTVSRTVVGGDTTTSIASALASSINGNSNLASIGTTASAASAVVTITTSGTTYSSSLSGGSTETITLGYNSQGNTVAAIGGVKKTGDVLTVTTSNSSLGGGSTPSSYTVLAGDTLVTIAAGLAAAMSANANLQTLGVSASSNASATLNWSQNFTANPSLPSGTSTANVSAIDGANNTKVDANQVNVNAPSSQTLTFDLNGNMTNDGTNSYKWDSANRLTEIDYPGSGNHTDITYTTDSGYAKIVEYANGTLVSTKQFVSTEERDASGNVTKMFFNRGEVISGVAYFYNKDHLGSVRIIANSAGSVQSTYNFSPYGVKTTAFELVQGDYQYAGYYIHPRSGLSLTASRVYAPTLARWLSRDPSGGMNLYAYVDGNPIGKNDPSGLDSAQLLIAGPHVGLIVHVQADSSDPGTYYIINGYFAGAPGSETNMKLIVTVDASSSSPIVPWVVKGYIPAFWGPSVKETCPGELLPLVKKAQELARNYNRGTFGYTGWPGVTGPAEYATSNQVIYSLLKENKLPIPDIVFPAPGYNLGPLGLPHGYY